MNMLDGATPAQEDALLNLLGRMGSTRVKVRVVEEFDGQIGAPVAVEIVGGTTFLIDGDGDVKEYQRDADGQRFG